MSEVTDIPSLNRKYRKLKKARIILATEPTLFMLFWCFLHVDVICETLTDNIIWCINNHVPVTLSISILYSCTQEMSSFHFKIIALKNSHFGFLPSVSQFWPVFRRMTYIYICNNISLCTKLFWQLLLCINENTFVIVWSCWTILRREMHLK